jgi:citrate lyase subunit beta/citryl-CoA lyase
MKLRRSLVWVNGNDTKKLEAALASDADCIVFDLEDGVIPSLKPIARKMTAESLTKCNFRGKERIVRINALDTEYYKLDLETVLPAIPDAIRLPKCETVEYVLKLDSILTEYETTNGLKKNQIEVILMIETPLGIINTYSMAKCCDRVTAIGIGLEDLTTSLGIIRHYDLNSLEFIYAKQKLVNAGKAAGVHVIDSSALLKDDLDYIREDSKLSRRFGFDGRSVMEICHIDTINEAFTPTSEEVKWANEVVKVYEAGKAAGQTAIYFEGKFIDVPVVAKAVTILDRIELIENKGK